MAYNLLASHEITSVTSSFSFENIPSNAKDLLIVVSALGVRNGIDYSPYYEVVVNKDSSQTFLEYIRSYEGVLSSGGSSGLRTIVGGGNLGGGSPEHLMEIYIPNYATDYYTMSAKIVYPRENFLAITSIKNQFYEAIKSVDFVSGAGIEFNIGSTFKIYQIT